MRKILLSTAAVMAMAAASSAAEAGTYIPVPMVQGAVSQIVFSINNHNVVAGSFRDSAGVEHGFFGPLDGSNWMMFDFPGKGVTGTEARSINDNGVIVGIALNAKFKVGEEFYRLPGGKFKTFKLNGKKLDGIAQGMNAHGVSVGDYISTDGKTIGYTGQHGRYVEDFTLHLHGKGKFLKVSPRGIDKIQQFVAGLFVDQNGVQHGFRQSHIGKEYRADQIDYPGARSTAMEDLTTGQWSDADGNIHSFVLNSKGVADLDPKDGSTSQQAWGANQHGLVALSTNIGQSYIYCPKKHLEKCPPTRLLTKQSAISSNASYRYAVTLANAATPL